MSGLSPSPRTHEARPSPSRSVWRQTCSVEVRRSLTCSSARELHVLELSGSVCGSAACRAGELPGCHVAEAVVVALAPRRPASGARRGSDRRSDSSRSSASRHMSSPSSKKSATRPAFSRDWLSSSPSPRTAGRARTRSRSSESRRARARAPLRCGPCRSAPT